MNSGSSQAKPTLTRQRRHSLRVVIFAVFLALTSQAAEPASAVSMPGTGSTAGLEKFRQLLSMTKGDRAMALASFPEKSRVSLQRKLNEYDALTPQERELRLQATQLRALLLPLMRTPPGQRQASLGQLPPELKPLILQRLQQWDILPPPLQDEVFAYESTIHFFLRIESSQANQRPFITAALPEERRRSIEQSLDHFQQLNLDEQRQAFERFQVFFALTPSEKRKALAQLAEPERNRLETTLVFFDGLNTSDREALFQSFRKFASLSHSERALFLGNAERWQAMSNGERNAWRKLIISLPPLPPGLNKPGNLPPGTAPITTPPPAPPAGINNGK